MRFILLLLIQVCLFSADYDYIVVGSSPFSLFEALYHAHSGKKVLVLEEDSSCGGAWKSICACDIPHADLGCHQIGHDLQLKDFLEVYAGCKIVSLDHPTDPFDATQSPNGWYFSKGCHELIDHLLQLLSASTVSLKLNTKAERVVIDSAHQLATVQTKEESYTANKLILTPMSSLELQPSQMAQSYSKMKYYHLYLLVQDPTLPRFSYRSGIGQGASRMMNLTHFLGMAGTGQHLIVVQTHAEHYLQQAESYIEALKSAHLLDPSAYILSAEPYIYEAGTFHQGLIAQTGGQGIIEMLQTGHIQNLSTYVSKWKQVLKPFSEAIH